MDERVALFAPIYDPRTAPRCFLRFPGLPPTAIAAGNLTLLPGARILIEHNPDRPVGYVRSLFRMPWPDGLTWHAALVELDSDGWPGHQSVSVGYTPIREAQLNDGRSILERAIVDELSITSKPAIAGARLRPPAATRTQPGVGSPRPTSCWTRSCLSARETTGRPPGACSRVSRPTGCERRSREPALPRGSRHSARTTSAIGGRRSCTWVMSRPRRRRRSSDTQRRSICERTRMPCSTGPKSTTRLRFRL